MIHEVASLVKDQGSAPILPTEPPPDLRPYLKVVYVAFAIDTTASMQSTIEAARKLASEFVATASRRFGDIRLKFALVEYRDASRSYGFKARTVTTFTSPEGFLASLNRTNAATKGDGSVDESVLDGVALAPPARPRRPLGRARQLADRPGWGTGHQAPRAPRRRPRPRSRSRTGQGPGASRQGGRDHDRDRRDRTAGGALARRAGALPRPVADPGRGVVSAARQGDRLRRSGRADHRLAAGGGPDRRATPGAHRRSGRARPDHRRAGRRPRPRGGSASTSTARG